MELLITPAQVAAAAFRAPDLMTPEAIPEATILAAQQKYVRPVLGDAMCQALARGGYADFSRDYLQPALALYVKVLMLPSLAVQSGPAGVVEVHSVNLARAGEGKIRAAVRRLRGDARALMLRAVERIEASPDDFPEYDASRDVVRRCATAGGVILEKRR